MPLGQIREGSIPNSLWQPQLLLSLLLILDSYLGMTHNAGIILWSSILTSDLKWFALSLEMMTGSVILVRFILNHAKPKWKTGFVILSPIIVILITFAILELVLNSLNRTATINFNFSSVGFSGLYWSAVYLSIAIGLTLTYKVQRFANFAQAETMILGSYIALILMWSDRFFPISNAPKDGILNWELLIWSGIGAFFITGFVGLIIDRVVYKRFRNKLATPQVMMIASLGVSMILRALIYLRFSAATFRFIPDRDWRLASSTFDIPSEQLQVHLGNRVAGPFMDFVSTVGPYGLAYSKIALIVGIFGALLILLMVLHKSRLGRQMRAVSDNSDLAASSGIHVERVHAMTAFISSGIAGLGGALLASILPINPELGLTLLLPAFAVIVLGTIGSIPGVIIGSLIVGFLRAGSEPVLIGVGNALDRPTASGFAEVMPFIFLVGILLLAPKGIGDAVQSWNIERIRKRRLTQKFLAPSKTFIAHNQISRLTSVLTGWSCLMDYLNKHKDIVFQYAQNYISAVLTLFISNWKDLFTKTKYSITPKFPPFTRFNIPRLNFLKIDRETERGSWIMFVIFLLVLIGIVWILPSVSNLTKTLQVARIVTLVGIFGLASFSLNLHTGYTGMTNFGVIFFVGIGAVFVGLLSAPVETNGYGWSPWSATIVAVLISAIAGWLLAYPTARLRMDYFAIVTISLGEMLRISLQAEPLLRAGTVTSAIGLSQYPRPLEGWWGGHPSELIGSLLGLPGSAPYVTFLAFITILSIVVVWVLLHTILNSPWGRILRSIRENELVSQHHGHNILTHKAASLALGAAIAALAGALWAWLNTAIWPDFMNPVRSTFLIWAAFIVGGRGNNRGMLIGAFVIVIVEFVFNVLVVSRGSASLPLHNLTSYLDTIFSWFILDLGGIIWSVRSITEIFPKETIIISLSHLKLALIGLVIVMALVTSSKGLLPEVPSRPKRSIDIEKESTKNQREQ